LGRLWKVSLAGAFLVHNRVEVNMGLGLRTASRRIGIAGELLTFFMRNKRWWMLPVVSVVLLAGVLVLLAQSSALAPFIYSLF
jgi:uncharacterized protein DUF5989